MQNKGSLIKTISKKKCYDMQPNCPDNNTMTIEK